jgi:hypothetical protein
MTIDGIYIGASYDRTILVPGVPTSDPIVKAWLTAKNAPADADPGVLQKIITTANQAGIGQIVQDGSAGSGNGTGQLLFNFTPTDTTTLGALLHYYDVQVKLSSGKIFEVENSLIYGGRPRVTAAQA